MLLKSCLAALLLWGAEAEAGWRDGSAPALQDASGLLVRVGVIDDADRRTEADYAREHGEPVEAVKKRFAATGSINCAAGRVFGSAQLTIRNDIITTSAHALLEPRTCQKKAEPADCVFSVQSTGRERTIRIKSKIASGFDGMNCPQLAADDWLILKLAEPVSDITPYQVDTAAIRRLGEGLTVVAVGRSIDFRTVSYRDGRPAFNFPKHIGDCQIKQIPMDRPLPWKFGTNCDSAGFSSGGSLLSGSNGQDFLVAIHRGSNETDAQADEAMRSGRQNQGPFDAQKWNSTYVAITGEFYDALMKATSASSRP
jgi:hypothetical protein